MKIKLSVFAIFIALFIALGSASNCFGQTEQITGGYGDADVKDAEVVKAANFAIKKGAKRQKATIKLVSVKKAQMQVVAGLNYQICMQITSKKSRRKAVEQFVKVVVYRNLKNTYSLTSWTIQNDECGNE